MFIMPIPMPTTIVLPYQGCSRGNHSLNEILIMIAIAYFIVYYIIVICNLISMDVYHSKKEFLLALIPLYRTIKWCRDKWNELE